MKRIYGLIYRPVFVTHIPNYTVSLNNHGDARHLHVRARLEAGNGSKSANLDGYLDKNN